MLVDITQLSNDVNCCVNLICPEV